MNIRLETHMKRHAFLIIANLLMAVLAVSIAARLTFRLIDAYSLKRK